MSEKMDVLFLGRLFSRKNEEQIRSKARVDMQDAANVLQWNLIDGFVAGGCEDVGVVSYLPIDSWPNHYKDAFVKGEVHEIDENITFHQTGFCNVTVIKQILNRNICNRVVKRWAKKDGDKKKVVVCYSCDNTLLRAVAAAKRINSDVVSVLVIADITEFAANNNPNLIQKLYVKNQIKTNDKLMSYVDKFVLLTKQMKDKLGITNPYMVMEGIVPPREKCDNQSPENEKTILYTGSLNKKYGIMELLEAFKLIEPLDYRLIICGLGNAEEDIRELASRDSRVDFRGKVPHNEVLKLQSEATVLVNPRQNNEEFTKYSFPSKTMEYLASGTPVVAYKLDGIPDEYDGYINYVSDNTPKTLATVIQNICEMPKEERVQMGRKGRDYVLEEKNNVRQTKRILDFILD